MILVDANLLVYARVEGFQQHQRARDWLDERLAGSAKVGFPWESLVAFVRIVTNPRLFPRPERVSVAWGQVEAWLDAPVAWIPNPTDRHRETLGLLIAMTGVAGADIQDAHLAALAIQHGLTVCSSDSDFSRYPSVRWQNPIASER